MNWSDYNLSDFTKNRGNDIFDVHQDYFKWLKGARPQAYHLFYDLASETAPATRIKLGTQAVHDKLLLNLASYNYLGMAQCPKVIEAAVNALGKYGLGSSGSPYLSGRLKIHIELAEELAQFKDLEAVAIFPSGYSANVGLIPALVNKGNVVITDILAHASIIDGALLSGADLVFFLHNNLTSLERKLKSAPKGKTLVAVEGVYSMDGDVAPLADIAKLCKRYGARLMVDEAHSAFVYGKNGRGLVEHFGVEDLVDVHVGTLSKSLGGIGGYVAGSLELISYVQAYARSQSFSCALSPVVAAGVLKALKVIKNEPDLRGALWRNVKVMRESLLSHGIDIGESTSQIIPVMINHDIKIFKIVKELIAFGVYLNPICYPSVKKNKSRLRVSISAAHEPKDLRKAAELIAKTLLNNNIL